MIKCAWCRTDTPVNKLAYKNGINEKDTTHGCCSKKCFDALCEATKDENKFKKNAEVEDGKYCIDDVIRELTEAKQKYGNFPVYYVSDYDWVLPLGSTDVREEPGGWEYEPDGRYIGLGN